MTEADLDELIDFLEGELCTEDAAGVEQLLLQSIPERREFLKLSRVRDVVGASDPLFLEMKLIDHPEYQKDLTKNIMAKIQSAAADAVVASDPVVASDVLSASDRAWIRS